jgi:Mg-chelatase subunit ChlI
MPSRTFNPYSSAPPPPASLPDFIIPGKSIQPISNADAGLLIDSFLSSQDGKILTLHRLADHLLGRTQSTDNQEIEELEHVLEEERRREGGVLQAQPDDEERGQEMQVDEVQEQADEGMPTIETDKKKARKEERRLKKEREKEKRKRDDKKGNVDTAVEEKESAVVEDKAKKEKLHKKDSGRRKEKKQKTKEKH